MKLRWKYLFLSSTSTQLTSKTAAGTLAWKLTTDTKWKAQRKPEKEICRLINGTVCVDSIFTSNSKRYQNYQRLGVNRRQTPVSSPASQLHGGRHVGFMDGAGDVTVYLWHQSRLRWKSTQGQTLLLLFPIQESFRFFFTFFCCIINTCFI